MKRSDDLILRCAALCLGATLFVPIAGNAQQTVKVGGGGGTVVCSGDLTMQVDPAGNLTFPNCTSSSGGGGGNPTAPVCTNVVQTVNADAVATPTISSSCSNGGAPIDAYGWVAPAGAPFPASAVGTSSFTAGFPTAGTSFVYSVQAHNSVGLSNIATVTVNVVAPGACGTAQPTAIWTSQTLNLSAQPQLNIPAGSWASYKLPIFPTAGKSERFNATQAGNPGTVPLPTEFVISTCPGDFTNIQAQCKAYGDPQANLTLVARTATAPTQLGCSIATGTQYYLNIRNVDTNNVNSCTRDSCGIIIQHHGG